MGKAVEIEHPTKRCISREDQFHLNKDKLSFSEGIFALLCGNFCEEGKEAYRADFLALSEAATGADERKHASPASSVRFHFHN